ncbi:MAG: YafY family protein [Sulfuricellaceae bacterium]|nr:YafY family protein [Sulfuricellaceae bacterium]
MDRTERFYKIDQLLNDQSVVSIDTFLADLGISLATFKRDLEYMRERLNAPIQWDRDAGGYRYGQPDALAPSFALPGIWFNPGEVHALLTMQHLLSNLEPGLLAGHIKPLQARLKALLESRDHSAEEVETRFRIVHAARRQVATTHFELIASATLSRKRLKIRHYSRQTGEESERIVSPQQLVYYRDNWYVDTWCHLREGIRSFSIDAIRHAEMMEGKVKNLPRTALKAVLESGYGIFSGKAVTWAKLRFTPERARWVANELWHPKQKGKFDADGYYLLELPYNDDRELVMDILRHGAEVEVLAPESLRERVRQELGAALARYQNI